MLICAELEIAQQKIHLNLDKNRIFRLSKESILNLIVLYSFYSRLKYNSANTNFSERKEHKGGGKLIICLILYELEHWLSYTELKY